MAAKNTRQAANTGAAKYRPRLIDLPKRYYDAARYNEYDEYINLLLNSIAIRRADGLDMPYRDEVFIKKCLIELNVVGYRRIGDMWLYAAGLDIDPLGFPKSVLYRTANGITFPTVCADYNGDGENYIIYALPFSMSLAEMVRDATDEITGTDIAIRQNRIACQTPWLAFVRDENTKLTVEQALQQKESGKPAVIVSADIVDGVKGVSFETPYLVDKFLQYRDAVRDRLFNKLGIMSANVNKRERVQVGEVNATVGQCLDYVYMLVDNVNKQFKYYNIPYEMIYNGTTEELYANNIGGE